MRLNYLKSVIQSLPLNAMALQRPNNQPNGSTFNNLRKFKELLAAIEDQPFFKSEIEYLKQSALYATTANEVFVAKDNESDKIYTTAYNLMAQLYGISLMLNKLAIDDQPEVISIRLPNPDDFSGLIDDLSTFKTAIEQIIINPVINGQLRVTKWETGSFWINLYLGSSLAVLLVGSVAWSALILSKKFAEFSILYETAKSLKIRNESLEDLKKQQEALTASLVDSEARYIEEQSFNGSHENERLERIKRSIKTFATMIQRGAQVEPSLMAPEVVKNLFPNFLNPGQVTSRIPLLKNEPESEDS